MFGDVTRTDLSIKSNNMNKEEAECESDYKMNMGKKKLRQGQRDKRKRRKKTFIVCLITTVCSQYCTQGDDEASPAAPLTVRVSDTT